MLWAVDAIDVAVGVRVDQPALTVPVKVGARADEKLRSVTARSASPRGTTRSQRPSSPEQRIR